ncbi:mitochondrial carrier homolog 2-like [Antedon mediterranea]|uniref:mitochondrial carrier homolog 2-like n=1 Tax=Antedon mediterranea TaxID=105859 RepID=UPI003AF4E911
MASMHSGSGPDPWTQFALNIGLTTVAHPLTYVKTLIQIGFEPLPQREGRNIFMRRVTFLPGFFEYAGHIKKVDGFTGLYRGLCPRICESIVGNSVSQAVQEKLDDLFPTSDSAKQKKFRGLGKSDVKTFTIETSKVMVSNCVAVIINHPFHVVAVRSMVQFVGKETLYSGWFSPFTQVYNDNGIAGFFAGLAPRLLLEISSLWLARALYYLLNNYILDEQTHNVTELRSYSRAITGFFASMITYPLGLISNIMAVNNSGLAASRQPYMPTYTNWLDCCEALRRDGDLKRGSSIFWRQVPKGRSRGAIKLN